ncbi:MAG: MFS transporter [Anaeromicrobium sp.]|uniref:MFS transporter n=1 Tax=Anaeromicrobium sp. TaxID=1929132 RepID=UPI0025F4752C|nr:MFS transporter [Anaeromicrobium sp.]MCT4595928.1 MFS transporter [Anaeromicrobium sp.]
MNKKIIYLTIAMFFMSILANTAHPVTPELVVSLNMSSLMYGIMFAAMSVASFIMSPIWGSLSDRYESRKLFLCLPSIGYALAQIGFGFSTSPLLIILFRIMGGTFACSIFTVSIAYIVDETTSERRSEAISVYTAITRFGISLGYLIGGYIGAKDYHYAFILQSSGLLLHALLVYFLLPESNMETKRTEEKNKFFTLNFNINFKEYMTRSLGILLFLVLLTSFSYVAYNTGINYFLKKHLSLNPLQIGYYMAFMGIIGIIANVYMTPRISKKYGEKKSLKYVLLITGVTLILLSTFDDFLSLKSIVLLVVFLFFLSMYRPLLQTLISRASKRDHGKIMGLQNSANSVGMVGGSLFAGALLDLFPVMLFVVAGVVFILSYLIILISYKEI